MPSRAIRPGTASRADDRPSTSAKATVPRRQIRRARPPAGCKPLRAARSTSTSDFQRFLKGGFPPFNPALAKRAQSNNRLHRSTRAIQPS
ncbi:hypothetical protein VARIO8X_20281 [Burkholderiales bacterium 8X]|nr:hypothetical protein VARIO8X_20281 [Burkholderiales bacterium 8X]